MKNHLAWALMGTFAGGALTANAADVSVSGFGTLGYAQSNQSYKFERFINDSGTVKRDSVAGLQMDAKLTDQIGATIQAKFAPSSKNDASWDGTLSWAFLSWRPSNDLLFRVGKQRVPVYLYSESMDVGVTHDFAHLPTEMYSTSPTTDYIGASFSKTWRPSQSELTLDGYAGSIESNWRFYQRDNATFEGTGMQPGANFLPFTMRGKGAVVTWLKDDNRYRVGLHSVKVTADPGHFFPASQTLVPASGFPDAQIAALGQAGLLTGSAYTVLPQARVDAIDTLTLTLGTEISLPKDFRVVGEYGRRKVSGADIGVDTNGGYFALLKTIGAWTPYVSYAVLKTRSDVLKTYQAVNTNAGLTAQIPMPALIGAAATVNGSQRAVADSMTVFDQNTIALGTSYRLTPTQKLKFEWARTRVGVSSNFVDAPSGGDVSQQNINVISFSYNFVF